MATLNREKTVARTACSATAKGIAMSVVRREQAPEDQHRFKAAADALLSELVRQQLGREGKRNG